MNTNTSHPWRTAFISAAISLMLLLPLLGFYPVAEVSEAREGSVIREILQGGNFFLPLRHGQVIPSKPPLFHWLGSLLPAINGELTEGMLRLPSALAAAAIIAFTAFFATWLSSDVAGLFAAGMLLSSTGFVSLAMNGRVDMLFSCFVVFSIFIWLHAAAQAVDKDAGPELISSLSWHLVGITASLAVLTKGPLGLVLPVLVIGSISFWFWKWAGLISMIRGGWLWLLFISFPWYVFSAQRGGSAFVGRQLIFENYTRFVGAEGDAIAAKPFYFYLLHFFLESPPWSFIFVFCTAAFCFKLLRGQAVIDEFLPCDKRTRFSLIAGLIWISSSIFLFSLSAGKRSGYLLPLAPAQALILRVGLWNYFTHQAPRFKLSQLFSSRIKVLGQGFWLIILLGSLVFFLSAFLPPSFIHQRRVQLLISALPQLCLSLPLLVPLYFAFFMSSWLFFWNLSFPRQDIRLFFVSLLSCVLLITVVFNPIALALKLENQTYRDFAAEVDKIVPEEQVLQVMKKASDESIDSLLYYSKRKVKLIEPESGLDEPGYYLARMYWVEGKPELPQMKRISILLRGGRKKDTADDYLSVFLLRRE